MKTENGMPNHAAKCVAELGAEIAVRQTEIVQLTTAKNALLELYAPSGEAPVAAAVQTTRPAKVRAAQATQQPIGGGSPATAPAAGQGRAPSAEVVKLTATMRTCPEPFTVESLVVATGADKKACSNALTRGYAKGWLERKGRGEYARTKDFPAVTPAE